MLRRVVQVTPIAALLAIGIPQPSAEAMGVPSVASGRAAVLVGEGERRRGEGGSRGERRSRDDGGSRAERRGRDDGRDFRGDDGRRAFREDEREFRRHRRGDDRDRWFGFGRRDYFDDYGDCGWLRRRAIETGSDYWWRRYRLCRGW